MAQVINSRKPVTVNPLKLSQPLGAALAFLGLNEAMPCFHGVKGCTSFGLVTFVKHFRESIPFQSTALDEIGTILGGYDNVEQALKTIREKTQARIIGLCTTGLTEVRGEDMEGDLRQIRAKNPELHDVPVVYVSTPDFSGSFEDGWAKAVTAVIKSQVCPSTTRDRKRVNVLPGSHMTCADIEWIKETIEAFDLIPVVVPDISGSLDGHMPEEFKPITMGGATVEDVRTLGEAGMTIAVGQQMLEAADALETLTCVPYHLFDRLTGLDANDRLLMLLSKVSGKPVPAKFRRQRSQLCDAMLDGQFTLSGAKVCLGGDPDLIYGYGAWLAEMGAEVQGAVTTTSSPILERMPLDEVAIGDLEELEARAQGCDLVIANYHARLLAERVGAKLFRAGYPVLDRLGPQHQLSCGYKGTRDLIFTLANLLIENSKPATPDTWALDASEETTHAQTPLN